MWINIICMIIQYPGQALGTIFKLFKYCYKGLGSINIGHVFIGMDITRKDIVKIAVSGVETGSIGMQYY